MGQATTNVVTAVAGLTFPLYAPDPAGLTALNHAAASLGLHSKPSPTLAFLRTISYLSFNAKGFAVNRFGS